MLYDKEMPPLFEGDFAYSEANRGGKAGGDQEDGRLYKGGEAQTTGMDYYPTYYKKEKEYSEELNRNECETQWQEEFEGTWITHTDENQNCLDLFNKHKDLA